jgi:hypothetical protein
MHAPCMAHPSYACLQCRDCGVFPGSSFAGWASCTCEAGRLRCSVSWCSDFVEVEELEGEVQPHDQTVLVSLDDLDSGKFPTGMLRLSRFAVRANDSIRQGFDRTDFDLDIEPAMDAVQDHGKGQPKS